MDSKRYNPLWPHLKTKNTRLCAACYKSLCHYDPLLLPPDTRASSGVSAPLSNSLAFWLPLLYVWDWHRRECEWEQWYGGWALACCQLFWWLQIASALVGWSKHQQAEELSKELPQLSLIHAWCTTRWQNTATAYGGGGGQQRVEGTGGGASEENRGAIRPILRDFN